MKKLFLVALFSMPLLSVARGEEGNRYGDSFQQGDATPVDAMTAGGETGHGGGMSSDSTRKSGKNAKQAKKSAESKMQDDGTGSGGSMQHDGQMDQGTTK